MMGRPFGPVTGVLFEAAVATAAAMAGATTDATQFTPREMMAIAAGRFISDGDVLFAGTGVALLAAGCAKRIHAPPGRISKFRPRAVSGYQRDFIFTQS